MDSSDDVEMALLLPSDTDDEPEALQASQPPPRVRIPFYEVVPGELPPQVAVPTFVYANQVYHWTERNLL